LHADNACFSKFGENHRAYIIDEKDCTAGIPANSEKKFVPAD